MGEVTTTTLLPPPALPLVAIFCPKCGGVLGACSDAEFRAGGSVIRHKAQIGCSNCINSYVQFVPGRAGNVRPGQGRRR